MDFSIMVYAVIALVGVAIGWLFASYQHAQQKAEQLAEREEMVAELSAAKQQITQSEHWRAECELLNNEVRSLQSINTSLEADLREVTTRMEAAQHFYFLGISVPLHMVNPCRTFTFIGSYFPYRQCLGFVGSGK